MPWAVGESFIEQVIFELNLDGWVGDCQLEREEITCSNVQSCEKFMICHMIERFDELTQGVMGLVRCSGSFFFFVQTEEKKFQRTKALCITD